ncbi:MAG: DUF309 domain-containing protein [Candidatus Marinimicrobia bacterium]|nr:DUF309 domain-containing protein [Candidatus Neomarinimicrobiota bacterium]
MPPRKRKIEEISVIQEPVLNESQQAAFQKGIDLFNARQYWEAHEAWEDTWMEMADGPEDDGEIILRGLIQFTAGLHGLTNEKPGLGENNFRKAAQKLVLYKGYFLGIKIPAIVDGLNHSSQNRQELEKFSIIRNQGELKT